MSSRKKQAVSPPRPAGHVEIGVTQAHIGVEPGMSKSQLSAAIITRSGMTAPTLRAFAAVPAEQLSTVDLMSALQVAGDEVTKGNLSRLERLLVNQAISLDAMFNHFCLRAHRTERLNLYEVHMKLALRAQAQSRAAVEALAAMKNPPLVLARQANITQGPLQVNNLAPGAKVPDEAPAHARARETPIVPIKLIAEDTPHGSQTMDPSAAATTRAGHSPMEAVGAVQRTRDKAGQGAKRAKRVAGR